MVLRKEGTLTTCQAWSYSNSSLCGLGFFGLGPPSISMEHPEGPFKDTCAFKGGLDGVPCYHDG